MNDRNAFLRMHLKRIDGVAPGAGLPKHIKMTTSPFVFLRGSSQLFYADIQGQIIDFPAVQMPITTVMGDCHTSNFGFFTEEGSHGDEVIFAINDFDDACFGNPLWDLLRFCVSLRLCADHCQRLVKGEIFSDRLLSAEPAVSDGLSEQAIHAFFDGYMSVCQKGDEDNNHLDQVFNDFESPSALVKRFKKAKKRAAGSEHFLVKSSLAKAINIDNIPLMFRQLKDKFLPLAEEEFSQIKTAFAPYMNDSILDIVARQGSGTGSVNMERFYFLVGPENLTNLVDLKLCHVVEVKQQREAAPLYYFPDIAVQNKLNPAHLTARCQRLMQRKPDILVDEAYWQGQHWLIRSRHHAKVGIDPEHIGIGHINTHDGGFVQYARACGVALALAHCRGDRRSLSFEHAMLVALPKVQSQLQSSSKQYASQVIADWQWLKHVERIPPSLS